MAVPHYSEVMGEALDRLSTVGYEYGTRSRVNHAPMAAEALAHMGYTGEVPAFLDRNLSRHAYHEPPRARWPLSRDDPADWRSALGAFGRVGDWTALFARELADRPWTDVLARWAPRLLPGSAGALGHGAIRAAHAVRAVAAADRDDRPQLAELAHGLGYWAARFARTPGPPGPAEPGQDAEAAQRRLETLVADAAGAYAAAPGRYPVPLIHTVTLPAAIRLMSPYLPAEQRGAAAAAAARAVTVIRSSFAGPPPGPPSAAGGPAPATPPSEAAELFAEAVEIGDEHAIKLAEVAVRHGALLPDGRYAAAVRTANRAIGRLAS